METNDCPQGLSMDSSDRTTRLFTCSGTSFPWWHEGKRKEERTLFSHQCFPIVTDRRHSVFFRGQSHNKQNANFYEVPKRYRPLFSHYSAHGVTCKTLTTTQKKSPCKQQTIKPKTARWTWNQTRLRYKPQTETSALSSSLRRPRNITSFHIERMEKHKVQPTHPNAVT